MNRNQLVTKLWVMFTLNYRDMSFIDYICEKTGKKWLVPHLTEEFSAFYGRYGSKAVMNVFYCSLDENLKDALVDYCIKVYSPQAMLLTDKEMALLSE